MAWLMDVIKVFVVVGSVVRGQVKVEKDDNIEPFALLCRVYNAAKNPPINYVDLQVPFEIVTEIDALNRSLLEEEGLHQKEDSRNNSEAQVKQIVTREAALAQLSLNQITQKAHKILEDIKKINVTKEIGNAKTDFAQVIFGENGNQSELEQTVLSGVKGRADACGKPGEGVMGTHAGKNLVVDFFCLCVQRQDGQGANQVCGFYVGSGYENGQLGWNDTGTSGSSTMWASIKGGCGKHVQKHPASTAEALHILDQFLKHLKAGGVYRQIKCEPATHSSCKNNVVEGGGRKEGMLGTGVTVSGDSGLKCDGKEGGKKGSKNGPSPGGVCVYYGQDSENWKDRIGWLKKFQTALVSVEAAKNQTASIKRYIKKLQMLLHRAEEIHETTRVISEIQNLVGLPAALQNTSGNQTVFNTTRIRSYSYYPNLYYIPPWVLLILS